MGTFLKRNVPVSATFAHGLEGVYQHRLGIGMILEVHEALHKPSRRRGVLSHILFQGYSET